MKTTASHMLTSEVKLLQKAVVLHAGKLLILKRSADSTSRADMWDLPGGNTEWPTDTSADIRDPHRADIFREIFEETGISISETTPLKSVYIGSYFAAATQIYTSIVGWQVALPDDSAPQDVLISDEHSDFAWITPAEFDAYDFGFAGNATGFIRKMVENADT